MIWARMKDLRPVAFWSGEHGPHAPARAKDIKSLGKAVVIDDPSVHGENPHQ